MQQAPLQQMSSLSSLQHVAPNHHHVQSHLGGMATPNATSQSPSALQQQQQQQQDFQAALGFYHFANIANLNQIYRN
jgi:hypothetical protein